MRRPIDSTPKEHESRMILRERILVDDAKNVRNFGQPIDRDAPDTHALVKLIARDGQLKAVSVRPLPRHHESGKTYILDTGFRRMCALDLLARPTVFCTIVEGEESEVSRVARVVGENEGHKPLSPAELAHACAAMRDAAKASGEPLSMERLGDLIGRAPSYCKELLLAHDCLIVEVANAWRGGAGAMRLPVSEAFRFARMGAGKQREQWEKFLRQNHDKPKHRGRPSLGRGPRPLPRNEVDLLLERAPNLTSILIGGRYVKVTGDVRVKLVRAAVLSTLRYVADRDAAIPFKSRVSRER